MRESNVATRGLVSKQLNRRPTVAAVADGGGLSFLIEMSGEELSVARRESDEWRRKQVSDGSQMTVDREREREEGVGLPFSEVLILKSLSLSLHDGIFWTLRWPVTINGLRSPLNY